MHAESPVDELTNLNRESKISQIMQQNSDLNHLNMNELPTQKWNMQGTYQSPGAGSPYLPEKPYNLVSSLMAFKENSMLSSYGESLTITKQPSFNYNS